MASPGVERRPTPKGRIVSVTSHLVWLSSPDGYGHHFRRIVLVITAVLGPYVGVGRGIPESFYSSFPRFYCPASEFDDMLNASGPAGGYLLRGCDRPRDGCGVHVQAQFVDGQYGEFAECATVGLHVEIVGGDPANRRRGIQGDGREAATIDDDADRARGRSRRGDEDGVEAAIDPLCPPCDVGIDDIARSKTSESIGVCATSACDDFGTSPSGQLHRERCCWARGSDDEQSRTITNP